ncbi:hypothetical protein QNI16_27645 [Cytophagaceae bacterium YF14B1]|uniref:Uncharacterized protein n=1 Tax=Xanthocytophaga flava TaxID=3048013 RepID=A0AAE3QRU1_9BACT|nr:hypothetical protein [Xanthocytophaga flavus]MDJ1484302.1 hypothetical protein [Xanthocytophaga flavus]
MNHTEFVPQSNRTCSKLALGVVTVIFFLTNCSNDNQTIVPKTIDPSASQEITSAVPEPIAIASPLLKEVDTDLSGASFAKTDLASGRLGSTTDFVDFANEQGLSLIPDKAINQFATSPFYMHPVGNAWVHVEENSGGDYFPKFISKRGFYHLPYQNFTPCYPGDGTTGKPSGKNCVPILNPEKENRTLYTHDGKQWIKVYANDHNTSKRVFDLLSINVLNGPIQLVYKKENGGWFHLASLSNGKKNISAHTTGITEVLISSAQGTSGIQIDNLEIRMPSN